LSTINSEKYIVITIIIGILRDFIKGSGNIVIANIPLSIQPARKAGCLKEPHSGQLIFTS